VALLESSLREGGQGLHDGECQFGECIPRFVDRHPIQHGASADQELMLSRKELDTPQELGVGCTACLESRQRASNVDERHDIDAGLAGHQRVEDVRPLRNDRCETWSPGDELEERLQRGWIGCQRCEQMRADQELSHETVEAADDLSGVLALAGGREQVRLELGEDRPGAGRARRMVRAPVPVIQACNQALGLAARRACRPDNLPMPFGAWKRERAHRGRSRNLRQHDARPLKAVSVWRSL
jgi:hypothetical protein